MIFDTAFLGREIPREEMRRRLEAQHIGPSIIARVMRLNPTFNEATVPRGIHRKETIRKCAWRIDVCTHAAFDRRWGRGSCRRLVWWDLVQAGGKRRWITRLAYETGPLEA